MSLKKLPKKSQPIPEKARVFTAEEFNQRCEDGDLIDDDGYGQYAIPPLMFSKVVYPSDSPLDSRFTHVVWFNR